MKKWIACFCCLLLGLCFGLSACRPKGWDPYVPTTEVDWDNIDWEGNNDTSNNITVIFSQQFRSYYDDLVQDFTAEHPEYTVTPIYAASGGGVYDKQNNDIGARNAPDVFVGGDVYLSSYQGLLMPLDKLVERDAEEVDPDDFLPGVLDNLSGGGHLYFLPEYVNVGVLYYNKELFDRAGLSYPTDDWTYDQFYAAAKQFTKKKTGDEIYEQWGVFNDFTWWGNWLPLVRMFGGEVMNAEGYVTLDTDEAIAAFESYAKWTGKAQQPDTWGDKIAAGPTEDTLGGFEGKKTAMLYGGNVGNWLSYSGAQLDWDIAKLPVNPETGKSGAEFAIQGYGIFQGTKNVKGSWEFIKYLTRKRTSVEELNQFGYPTPRTSGKELLLSVPKAQRAKPQNIEALFDTIEEGLAMPLPKVDYFNDVAQNKINPYIVRMLNGEKTPRECAIEMTEQANFYIRDFYLF